MDSSQPNSYHARNPAPTSIQPEEILLPQEPRSTIPIPADVGTTEKQAGQDDPKQGRHQLTRDQRLQILTMHSAGWSTNRIADHFDFTPRQVRYTVKAPNNDPTPGKRTGRPSKLSSEQVDELIAWMRESKANRQTPIREVATGRFAHWGVGWETMKKAMRRRGFSVDRRGEERRARLKTQETPKP